jgi:septum formation protein
MPRLILGSQSPRRREILSFFSIPFEQATPPFIEEAVPFHGDPVEYATSLAKGKAESLHRQYPKAIILTADTVVYCNQKIYNKPCDFEEAVSFLSDYSGKWQSVFTGVSVRCDDAEYSGCEETKVLFNTLTTDQIHRFLNTISWQDKGGGYTIQGVGSLVVRKIDGCYYNVTGLPVNTVRELLLKAGIDLWHYIK